MGQQEIKEMLQQKRANGDDNYYTLNQISFMLGLELYNIGVAKQVKQLVRFKYLEMQVIRRNSPPRFLIGQYRALK